jgi:hypothetical protein
MNLLLLALVPACFALNPVIGRALADQFGPATLSVVRWALSAQQPLASSRASRTRTRPRSIADTLYRFCG